jgi:hypothetical protein
LVYKWFVFAKLFIKMLFVVSRSCAFMLCPLIFVHSPENYVILIDPIVLVVLIVLLVLVVLGASVVLVALVVQVVQ